MPKRWPIGFSFGKYLRAAVSLMTTTFGAFSIVAIGEVAARRRSGISIVSKKSGEIDEAVDRCRAGRRA